MVRKSGRFSNACRSGIGRCPPGKVGKAPRTVKHPPVRVVINPYCQGSSDDPRKMRLLGRLDGRRANEVGEAREALAPGGAFQQIFSSAVSRTLT